MHGSDGLRLGLRSKLSFALVLIAMSAANSVTSQRETRLPPKAVQSPSRPTVFLTVTVTDGRDGYAGGLDKSAFTVYEDSEPQDITFFKSKDEPLSLGVLLDMSGSVYNPKDSRTLKWVREALSRFLKLSRASNEYFLVGFNTHPQVLSDWSPEGAALLKSLDAVKLEGETAFHDACLLGIEKVKGGRHNKRVLLIISDGEDTASKRKFDEVRLLLKRMDVLAYAVGMGAVDPGALSSFTRPVGEAIPPGMRALNEMALTSGGRVFYPQSTGELNAALELIALELRRQYRVGFSPARQGSDGAWHEVKVRVTAPLNAPWEFRNLSARTRVGYQSGGMTVGAR